MKPLLLAFALFAQDDPNQWLGADTLVTLPDRPALALVHREGSPRVALRWFLPASETDARAGAAELLVNLADQRGRSHAERIGASFDVQRTPRGIAYSVAGARVDLDHLFNVLRIASGPPESDPILIRRAREASLALLERDQESAERSLIARLSQSVCPGTPRRGGTVQSLNGLDAQALHATWQETHRPDGNSTLVIVGDVTLEVVLASLPRLGTQSGPARRAGRLYAPPRPERTDRAQVLRQWYGEAWPTGPAHDPRAVLAARLLGESVRTLDVPFDVTMEFVDAGCSTALLIAGGAYRQDGRRLRATVQGALAQTRDALSEEAVTRMALDVRREVYARAVTEEGNAGLVGAFLEESGTESSLRHFMERLDRLDRVAMFEFFDALLAREPLRAELDR